MGPKNRGKMGPDAGKPRFFLDVFPAIVENEPQEPRFTSSRGEEADGLAIAAIRLRRLDRRNERPMAKKAAPKTAEPKAATASAAKPATKADVYNTLSEKTGLNKKEIASVFTAMGDLIAKELGKKGPGLFIIPGLLKLKVVRKPATKAKQGINPFTKEPMTIKAKPARNVVKAVPLKTLKDLV